MQTPIVAWDGQVCPRHLLHQALSASTVLHDSLPFSTVPYRSPPLSTVLYGSLPFSTVLNEIRARLCARLRSPKPHVNGT
jgi:hypothetical protein